MSDAIIEQIKEFEGLIEGWDGYYGAKPNPKSIEQAIRFVQAAGDLAARLDPTLHVDGSVLLEVDDSLHGSLQFTGDGKIIFAIKGGFAGTVSFDGFTIPYALNSVFGV